METTELVNNLQKQLTKVEDTIKEIGDFNLVQGTTLQNLSSTLDLFRMLNIKRRLLADTIVTLRDDEPMTIAQGIIKKMKGK